MKTCRTCGGTDMATRSALCKEHHREYVREHYRANRQYYLDKADRHFKENLEIIRAAKSVPCMDCNISYPYYVMDFDHREDKNFNIGGAGKKAGKRQIISEIAKCDVVCANCHRQRTAIRSGYDTK